MSDNKEIKMTFRLEEQLFNDFKKYCKENGYSVSKRLRIIMRNDITKDFK
jgi:ribosomal protein L37E